MKATLTLITVACGVLLLAACRGGPRSQAEVSGARFDARAERREVYEAVLREMYVRPDSERVVLNPTTTAGGLPPDGTARVPETRRDTVASFRRASPGAMPRDIDIGLPVVWFTNEDWNALPTSGEEGLLAIDGKWTAFHEQFGSAGHISFSTIGFSSDGRQALLSVWAGYWSLAGAGHLVLLDKRDGVWRIRRQVMTVVS